MSQDVRSAFLADILANPKADDVRLIYADWLEEQGEGERAEFIRVQVELNQFDVGPKPWSRETARRVGYLMKRQRELLRGPKPEIYSPEVVWFNQGDGTETWKILFRPKWSRGFVSAITCPAADWLAHADALTAANPIEAVTLTTWPASEQAGTLYHRARELFEAGEAGDDFYLDTEFYLKSIWKGIAFTLPPPSHIGRMAGVNWNPAQSVGST
jgi:uncharacterized protein (TIGR02996 family)